MYKSYFYLNRYLLEILPVIRDSRIVACFTQEKDKLVLKLKSEEDRYLEFSVNPGTSYISLRKSFHRAGKNTIDIFPELNNSRIEGALISESDRIILIYTDNGNLYFAIRGKFTNVFLTSGSRIFSFKKEETSRLEKIKTEFENNIYISGFNEIEESLINGKSIEEIREIYPIIGKEIVNEVKIRIDGKKESNVLGEIINIFKNNNPALYFDKTGDQVKIAFEDLKIFSAYDKEVFKSLIEAFNEYISRSGQIEEITSRKKRINSYLDKEINRLAVRLNRLKTVIDSGSREIEYNKIGNLILINLNKIKTGSKTAELQDIYGSGETISVKLDPKLSPNQNAEKYFDKAKSDKINFQKSVMLRESAEKNYFRFLNYQKLVTENNSLEKIRNIMKELKIRDSNIQPEKEDPGSRFKHYIIEKKYHLFVGKDSANNDLLTTKFAKQNDFWFHARSVSGSHVVLRIENSKEAVPKSVLKKAASIAAYHSKSKTSGLSPVSYTLKKYVIKRKGSPVGQVSLTREDVLLVKPEIPPDCEFLAQE